MTREIVRGNEAIARGALDAGMTFFAGYPITPASEIMHYLAKQKEIVFIQGEDEIASINFCLGASLAGRKAMTATSGPGFSLMQESIGFGHMARVPMVIVNSQRVGPATGMPTFPSQGDVLQTIHGSHGDYFPMVFYPNSVEECYKYTIHAFNAAEESKTPIILLSDAILSHLHESVELTREMTILNRKDLPLGKNNRHVTGLLSKENTPLTKNSDYYNQWFSEYKEEVIQAAKNYQFYEYIENKDADTIIIAYGSVSRVILPLKEKYSIFRPIRLFPTLGQLEEAVKKYKRVIVIEMNDGQYASEIKKIAKNVVPISILGGKINLSMIKKELEEKNG